jgi:mannose-1-phosphate guanylyltransferase
VTIRSAMILCAGYGTRLRPLTEWLPKPLLPVGDRPALAHIVERLSGVELVMNAHHLPAPLRAFATERGIAVSEEPELLGTAGGIAKAEGLLGEGDLLVWNGDMVPLGVEGGLDGARIARAWAGRSGVEALLVVRAARSGASRQAGQAGQAAPDGREGNVGVDGDGRVVRLRKETTAAGEARSYDFLGVHVVGARLRDALPPKGCLVGDLYLPALRRGALLGVHETSEPVADIGTLADYLGANRSWLAARGKSSWIASSACVSRSVRVDDSVVGPGTTVDGSGPFERCIVWPGARGVAPAQDTVFAGDGDVERRVSLR